MKASRLIKLIEDVVKKYGDIEVVDRQMYTISAIKLGHVDTVYNLFVTPAYLQRLITEENANPSEFSELVVALE